MKKIPSTIASKRIKYLGINLTKEVKDLYTENQNTCDKTEEGTNKCKGIPFSGTGRINIVKMSTPPKEIYRFNVIPNNILIAFFTEIEQS